MKKSITIVTVVCACALLFASIAVVTPKAVQAAIATLIRDQDNAARHPFSNSCSDLEGFATVSELNCSFQVPAGEEYVIQNVTINTYGEVTSNALIENIVTTVTAGNSVNSLYYVAPFTSEPSPDGIGSTSSLTAYADPGTTVEVEAKFSSSVVGTGGLNFLYANVQGYYVTLP